MSIENEQSTPWACTQRRSEFGDLEFEWRTDLELAARSRCVGRPENFEALHNAARVGLWSAYKKYDPTEPWFPRVTRKAIQREISKEVRRLQLISESEFGTELEDHDVACRPEAIEDLITREVVREWVEGLGPKDREIIDLYYYQGQFQKEVGRRLGISQPAVWKRLRHIHERGAQELARVA